MPFHLLCPLCWIDLFIYMKVDWFISFSFVFHSISFSLFILVKIALNACHVKSERHRTSNSRISNGFIEQPNHVEHVNYRLSLWYWSKKELGFNTNNWTAKHIVAVNAISIIQMTDTKCKRSWERRKKQKWIYFFTCDVLSEYSENTYDEWCISNRRIEKENTALKRLSCVRDFINSQTKNTEIICWTKNFFLST